MAGPFLEIDGVCAKIVDCKSAATETPARGRSGANAPEGARKTSPIASTILMTDGLSHLGFQRDFSLKNAY
jgi:hypothetical protein